MTFNTIVRPIQKETNDRLFCLQESDSVPVTATEPRSISPTESLLEDLLDMCVPPIVPTRPLSPVVGLPICSSTPAVALPQPVTQVDDSAMLPPLPPLPSTQEVPVQTPITPAPIRTLPPFLTHQSISSPTVSSTCNQFRGSQFSTPQSQRSNRSDLMYSPMFPSPDSSTNVPESSTAAVPLRIPQYTSYPTGGPPLGQQDLLIDSPELQSPPALHEALQTEVRPDVLPLNLLQATLPPSGQFQSPQIPLSARSGMLQVALMNLEGTYRSNATELQRFYQIQSAKIEADRVAQLCTTRHVPSVLPMVNQYYDMQHHALIDNIDMQIRCLRYQFSTPTPSSNAGTNKENTSQGVSRRVKAVKKGKPKPLNDQAVRIMTSWYERHIQHPYPNNSAAEVLAKAGNITVEQVKKWFANKRMRSANTKPQREMAAAQRKHLLSRDPSEQPGFKKLRL